MFVVQVVAAVVIATSSIYSLPVGPTDIKLVHGVFDGAPYQLTDMPKAYARARKLLRDGNVGKSNPATAISQWDEAPWYQVEDNLANVGGSTATGLEDIGALFRCIKHSDGSWGCSHCTAFYIGKDLLVSSGHCIAREGITNPMTSLLFFVSGYDAQAGFTVGNADDLRVVKEWWIPEKFYNHIADPPRSKTSGYDVAFLRVDKAKRRDTVFYTLAKPDTHLGKDVFLIGYPRDTPQKLRPVRLDAKILEILADTPNAGLQPAQKTDIGETQLVLMPGKKGALHDGGSGAPVFPTATFNAQRRTVIGVAVWAALSNEMAKRNKATITQEANFTPILNSEIIGIAEALRDGGAVKAVTATQLPAGDATKKVSWMEWLNLA